MEKVKMIDLDFNEVLRCTTCNRAFVSYEDIVYVDNKVYCKECEELG